MASSLKTSMNNLINYPLSPANNSSTLSPDFDGSALAERTSDLAKGRICASSTPPHDIIPSAPPCSPDSCEVSASFGQTMSKEIGKRKLDDSSLGIKKVKLD